MFSKQKENGFTLLESLFVLSIFVFIILFSFLLLKPHHATLEKQLFFSQLQGDLLYAQSYAISRQEYVSVNFFPHDHSYYMKDQHGEILIKRTYSENITMKEGSMPSFFKYVPGGNISKFGSLYFEINGEIYRLTFLIGRGRFYVVKE